MTVIDHPIRHEALTSVATFFVDSGRVVPGLTIDEAGGARSQWWPLPSVDDRELVASLVEGDTVEGHTAAAQALGAEVDRVVRERLARPGVRLLPRRPGRRTVPEAWLLSLTAEDPALPESLDPAKVRAFADAVRAWVHTGAVTPGRVRLCLRVHEPSDEGVDRWPVELLVQDALEASLMVPIADVFAGSVLFGPGTIGDVLASLGRLVRLAPELDAVLDAAVPTNIELDAETLLIVARDRVSDLADVDIAVLLPSWWTRTGRVGLRAKASSKHKAANGSVTASSFGLDEIVAFTWEAALGGRRLTSSTARRWLRCSCRRIGRRKSADSLSLVARCGRVTQASSRRRRLRHVRTSDSVVCRERLLAGWVTERARPCRCTRRIVVTMIDENATISSDGCRLLTIDAAADFLAISRGAVYHLLHRGEMSSIHIGRSRRIPLAELRRFVADGGHVTPIAAT